MPDASLGMVTAKVTADNSQFDAAFKKSEEVVGATTRANIRSKKLEADAMAFAAKFAGDAISEQSLRIVAANKLQSQAQADVRKAMQLAKVQYGGEAESANLVAAAMQRLSAAWLSAAVASKVETLVAHASISEMQATSAAVRSFEGNPGIRAVERFLTTIPGVGTALKNIFPIVGALAFAGIIGDMAVKVYEFGERGNDLARELGTDWLTGAIGQVNGLAASVKQADDEISALAKDMDSLREEGRGAQIEGIRLTQGPAAAYRAEAADKRTQAAADEALLDPLRRDQAKFEVKSRQTNPDIITRNRVIHDPTLTSAALAAAKDLEATTKQIADSQEKINNLKQEAANLDIQADQVKEPKGPKASNAQARADASELMQDWRQQSEQMRALLKTDKTFHEALAEEFHRQAEGEFDDFKKVGEAQRFAAEQYRRDAEAAAAYARGMEAISDANRKAAESMSELVIRHQAATGAISAGSAARQQAALHATAGRDQLNDLSAQMGALSPEDQQGARGLDIQAKMAAVQGEMDLQAMQDKWSIFSTTALGGTTAALQKLTASSTNAGAAVEEWLSSSINDVNQGLVRMLTTRNYQHRGMWGGVGHDIMTSATGGLLKGAEGSLLKALGIGKADGSTASNALWVRMAAALGAVGGAVSGAGGAVTHTVGSFGGAVLHALHIPAFDVGTNFVPQDMLAMVHKGEAIVPAAYNNGSAGGGDTHLHAHLHGDNMHPQQVKAMMLQMFHQAGPKLAAQAITTLANHNSRVPSSRQI